MFIMYKEIKIFLHMYNPKLFQILLRTSLFKVLTYISTDDNIWCNIVFSTNVKSYPHLTLDCSLEAINFMGCYDNTTQLPNYDIYPQEMFLHSGTPVLLSVLDCMHSLKFQVTFRLLLLLNYVTTMFAKLFIEFTQILWINNRHSVYSFFKISKFLTI